MVKLKRFRSPLAWALAACVVSNVAGAELQQPGPQGQQAPMQVQIAPPPPPPDKIKIFDDRVFDLSGGTSEPTTRKSAGGTTRYLDKDKELDYNTEQRGRWLDNCASLKETNFKAYKDCVDSQKKKELGSRTNFGMREPRGGSDGLDKPSNQMPGAAGGAPQLMPSDLKPRDAEPQESGESEDE